MPIGNTDCFWDRAKIKEILRRITHIVRLYSRVERFSLFSNFWKRAHCYRLAIILWVQIQKIGEFCSVCAGRTCGKNFIFKKSQGPWKWIYFFKSWLEPSSYIKDQLPKIEFKIRGCLEFFFFFKLQKRFLNLKK